MSLVETFAGRALLSGVAAAIPGAMLFRYRQQLQKFESAGSFSACAASGC